ncbi:uncharacterized protein [Watersipora subatra]|uniref:uncharacterized protein n=1 Tax=Watersipora subatra TaxID=2589382 RepID=UPI00355B74F3
MLRQKTWRQFVNCQFGTGDAVDVYWDRLERLGKRLKMSSESCRSSLSLDSTRSLAAASKQQGSSSSCFQSDGNHRRKACQQNKLERKSAAGKKSTEASTRKSCFKCGSSEHLVASCPRQRSHNDLAAGSTSGRSSVYGEGAVIDTGCLVDTGSEQTLARISEYKCTQAPQLREPHCAELESWISKDWLKRCYELKKGIILLLAVGQPMKDKVHPVMDFRELNALVECHTDDVVVAVCADKIRKWRQLWNERKVVDLKFAYLQIHFSKDLWKYEVMGYKGVYYALTQLDFGLSCASRIMTSILKKVLALDERVHCDTDHYIDDIVVQESVLSAQKLRDYLARYGLDTKKPEALDRSWLLSVALQKDFSGHLQMSRGTAHSRYNLEPSALMRKELLSICGRVVVPTV